MTRVAVTGAAGRMGKTLVQAIHDADDLTLGAAFEHPDSPSIGSDAGEIAGVGNLQVTVQSDSSNAVADFDVVIDFTVPQATLALAEVCHSAGKAMVIGTTGFTETELSTLQSHAKAVPLFMAPNMSVGVNLTFKLIQLAAEILGDSVDVEVLEAHHRHKIDAPSGTAVRMGEILADALDRDLETDAIYGRQGITGARDRKTIGFSTMRGGDIVGEHTVMFAGEGERIEITHRAQSRMNFAQGALRAVRYVSTQDAGLYDMQTILGLK
ncbi:MAG: 4-hydroxy-tetrahydrodipicolinate reductase [Pseudomonadales bacterium]|nr:4-hydroxy-tetrahydrodipicolinate reductase [Pseudomonadales bacterium]